MASLHLSFLGSPRFTRDGISLKFTRAKGVALLAYLAIMRVPQRRERVMDLFWPDSRPAAARKNLRNTLWAIRKALGDEVLDIDQQAGISPLLSLNEALVVDVWQWQRLKEQAKVAAQLQAVEHYGGLLLDGIELNAVPDFEIWLTSERERLQQAQIRLLESLVAHYRQAGAWQEVLTMAQQVLSYDALQEPMYGALMEAYARLGQRSEALHQYEILQQVLQRELGVAPLPASDALRDAILRGDILDSAQQVSHQAFSVLVERPSQPLIARQAELAALDGELERARNGEARVVLLVGELGIGKSSLWQSWSASLPSDATVLEARSIDTIQRLPFAPLTHLFRTHACMQHLFAPDSPVPLVWLAEMTRLLPELHERLPALGKEDRALLSSLPLEEERHRLFEAFTQTLQALTSTNQPLIFFIDDLHWTDQATLDWLVYLLHRLQQTPLLLVAAYRAEEAPHHLQHIVAGWSRQRISQRVPLAALNPQDALELVSVLGAEGELAQRAVEESGGNPYFLTEFVRAAPDDTPPVLADLVCARVTQLPDTARQVLQAAAILAPDFDFMTLRQTSGRAEEETLNALDLLLEAHFLLEGEETYNFLHPFVVTVVRNQLSRARYGFLHRRAGQARERLAQLPQQAGQLVTHFAEAGNHKRAAYFAELAAQHALTLAAPAEAVAFYQQALALDPTPTRQMGLADAFYWQGDLISAQTALERARLTFEARNDQQNAAQASLKLAETYLAAGRAQDVLQVAQRSLTYLKDNPLSSLRSLAYFMLGTGYLETGSSLTDAATQLKQAIHLALEQDQFAIAASSHLALGNLFAEQGNLKAARQAFDKCIALAQRAKDPYQRTLGHNNAAYHALLDHDLPAAHHHIEHAFALTNTHALRIPLQYLYSTRGEIALAEKKWQEAKNWFQRGLTEAKANNNIKQIATYYANLALVAQGKNDLTQAITLMELAHTKAINLTAPHLQTQINLWLTDLYLASKQPEAAKRSHERARAYLVNSERMSLTARLEALGRLLIE